MSDEIKVHVASYGPRRALAMVYFNPVTGKKIARSTGTRDEREAFARAAVWQDELNTGRYVPASRLTWADFRKRVDAEKLAAMPESTQVAYRVALDHLQRLADPDRVTKLTPQVLSRFQAEARKQGMKATTLARHLRHIKAALRWGERQGLLAKAPAIEMPKLPKGQSLAKHRPVTTEEFERLLLATPRVRKHDAPQWRRLLRGLWFSGLRLSEALALDWNDGPFVLDTAGKHPAFRIEAEGQKSRRSEVVPATPDFVDWVLAEFPPAERQGKVFKMFARRSGKPLGVQAVGPVVSAIGRKAGVVVGTTDKLVEEGGRRVRKPVKLFAGAHDLRRSFCSRWARKVMPAVLQRLARHATIGTTMSYYVSLSADEMGADLWAHHGAGATSGNSPAAGNTCGNIGPKVAENHGAEN